MSEAAGAGKHDGQSMIRLDQFLKVQDLVNSGGEAKVVIQDGQVTVNGQTETRRRRQLQAGDEVGFAGQKLAVVFDDE